MWNTCELIAVANIDRSIDFYTCFCSAKKLLSIRLFEDVSGKRWQKNVKEEDFEVLCISQFTLYNRLKGNKPDFHLAMQGPDAINLYNKLLELLRQQYTTDRIKGKWKILGFAYWFEWK